jgi:hypothetical protein
MAKKSAPAKAGFSNNSKIIEKAKRKFVSFWLLVIGLAGYIAYRNNVIFELALIGAVCDLTYEWFGTKWGWWSYDASESSYMIAKRVPIGVVFTYFVMGMVAATYVLFRMS